MKQLPHRKMGNEQKKRNSVILKITLALLLIGLLAFLYWFYFLRLQAWTDDAYVGGNSVMVLSSQEGIVVSIYADDTDFVQQGQPLVQLDTTTYQLAFERAKVNLALAARQVKQIQQDVLQRQATVSVREADLNRAKQDYENRAQIGNRLAISKEDLEHALATLRAAEASYHLAQHELDAAIAALGPPPLEHHPTIENAKAMLRDTYVSFARTQILAPVTGFVAQRNVQLGQWVTRTRALMTIIPLNQIWVDANFKETQLTDVRLGQPVTITSDLYGSNIVYHGQVDGIAAGTGSVFALLPPQNASGNWIKVVQRLPVRIYLNPDELRTYPLRLGLSTYTSIDISDTSGPRLSDTPPLKPKLETPVFQVNMDEIEKMMDSIIQANLTLNLKT